MTQREAILDMLRAAGPDGLCSLSAYHRGPSFYNARNRVSELGKENYVIRSDRCQHDETTPSHVRWTLTREPTNSALPSNDKSPWALAAGTNGLVDGSAVRVGGKSSGSDTHRHDSQQPTARSGATGSENESRTTRGLPDARSTSPSREATIVVGVPTRTVTTSAGNPKPQQLAFKVA